MRDLARVLCVLIAFGWLPACSDDDASAQRAHGDADEDGDADQDRGDGDEERDAGPPEWSPNDAGDGPVGTAVNGEHCAADSQCVSGFCGASVSGVKYCYGDAEIGASCKITQDCRFGLCVDFVCTDENDLLPNGAVCTQHSDCRTGNCGTSVGGEQFCYGFVANGDACEITQDCAAGVCRNGTCADPGSCSVDGECALGAICNADKRCEQVCGANAYSADGSCYCLPGFEWASADPSDTNCVRPSVLAGCHIFAQDSDQTYLGAVGGCYESGSVCNEYGSYGSPYGSDSIFNEYGTYGSEYGSYSAFNPYTSTPPLLVCDGELTGCVTANEFTCSGGTRVHPSTLCSCL